MLIVSMIGVLIMYDVLQKQVTMKVIVITNKSRGYFCCICHTKSDLDFSKNKEATFRWAVVNGEIQNKEVLTD